jgi:hypothetical protein
MNVALAAAESGQEVRDFQELLARAPSLNQALGLLLVGGAVKRDAFVAIFPRIAEARHLRLLNLPAATSTAPASVARAAAPVASGPRAGGPSRPPAPGGMARLPAERPDRFPGSGPSFGRPESPFEDVGPAGALLVGVRYSTHPFGGRPKISSVQPLYRASATSPTLIEGDRHGEVTGAETTAVARPGYAVGAMRNRTGLSLDGFILVFMKVDGDRLDSSDSYESPVLGDSQGGRAAFVPGNRRPAIGVRGRAAKNVNALGLILQD